MHRILLFTASVCSGAGLFTKQLRCSDGICTNVLSGLITLTNEEAFEYESFNVKDVQGAEEDAAAAADIPVMLKIEKSRLLIAYGLRWEKDVVGSIAEDVYDYTWANAGGSGAFEGSDFDRERCAEELSSRTGNNLIPPSTYLKSEIPEADSGNSPGASELEQLLKGGRVCGCRDTGWAAGSYTDVQRSDLNCNAWPAVFRPGSTTWASRHCPRLMGPMYSIYSIREWKWEYHVKVTMSWTATVTRTRSYYLNWTNPEVRDEELDFTFKILFSLPQFGQQPPDLHATHYLLVPKSEDTALSDRSDDDFLYAKMTAEERALDALAGQSLLVPKERLDLSGRGCEKIGVSLYTWAREENGRKGRNKWVAQQEFCEARAGSCIHLQPNDLLEADKKLIAEGKQPQWILKDHPLDGWSQTSPYILSDRGVLAPDREGVQTDEVTVGTLASAGIIAWPTDQSHSTQLEVSLNSSDIAWLPNTGLGEIEDILVHAAGSVVSLLVVVRNKETKESKFTVAVPLCALLSEEAGEESAQPSPPTISAAPVSKSIRGERTSGVIVPLDRATGSTKAAYTCQIQLLDSQGSLLTDETATVEFASRSPAILTLDQPLQSDSPVNNFRINPSDLQAQAYTPDQHLRAIGDYTLTGGGGWFGGCQCDLWNIWCFATHIVDCTKAVRSIVLFVASLAGASILLVAFLPCLVRTCASCMSYTGAQIAKSRREIRGRKNSHMPLDITRKEITAIESSDVPSTPTSICTVPRQCNTPRTGRQNPNRSVRSRCSRRAHDYASPLMQSADQSRRHHGMRDVARSALVDGPPPSDQISRHTSRRCSPAAHLPDRKSRDYSSRPTTASLRRTPPPERHMALDDRRRRELLRTLREKRKKANNSSFADDDNSSNSASSYDRNRRRS